MMVHKQILPKSVGVLITTASLISTGLAQTADAPVKNEGTTDKVESTTLSERLLYREKNGSKSNKEVKAEFAKGIAAVKDSGAVKKAKQVGDVAPDFTLTNATDKKITLSEELKKGPVVLTWYRGGWCPYCNITLHAMQEVLPEIHEAGAGLLALTPELPNKTMTTLEKNGLEFEVLTDLNHKVAKDYDLVFKLTPGVEKLYNKFFDIESYNGAEAGTDSLPLAATYIIGQDGKILWSFLHHDYHKRAEPKDIVNFLNKLKAEKESK